MILYLVKLFLGTYVNIRLSPKGRNIFSWQPMGIIFPSFEVDYDYSFQYRKMKNLERALSSAVILTEKAQPKKIVL